MNATNCNGEDCGSHIHQKPIREGEAVGMGCHVKLTVKAHLHLARTKSGMVVCEERDGDHMDKSAYGEANYRNIQNLPGHGHTQ